MTDGPKILNHRVTRRTPEAEWSFDDRWHSSNTGAAHRREAEVRASFAVDMPKVVPPTEHGDAPVELPNNFEVVMLSGDSASRQAIRFTRKGAEQLVTALTAALDWDGK